MARDREGFTPYLFTIVDRLDDGWYSGDQADLMRLVGSMKVTETVSLLRRPWRMRSGSEHEYRLAPKDAELFAAAQMLARFGEAGAALVPGEAPDFVVRLRDGRGLRVEVSEVVAADSAYKTNAMMDLRIALREAVDADSSAWPTGKFVSFNFGPAAERPPNADERRAIVTEALSALRLGDYCAQGRERFFDATYPTLQRFGSWLYVGPLDGSEKGYVDISGPAFTYTEDSLVAVARQRLAVKQSLRYGGEGPLWLLLPVTDQRGLFHGTVGAFQALELDIKPFDRVILTYDGQMAIHDAV